MSNGERIGGAVRGLAIDYKGSINNPSIGPFLSSLLIKLDEMIDNSFYVNLQLTGIISFLASYRHPLLASLLLNPNLTLRHPLRSLFPVCK
jgi:hypothetical protein